MKTKTLLIHTLVMLLAFPSIGTLVQAQGITIEIRQVFDYPGTGNLTRPQKINNNDEIFGEFVDSSGITRGFFRYHNGTFSVPIVEPTDSAGFTEGRGLNDSRAAVGDFIGSDGILHGFLLNGHNFTQYDVPGSLATETLGINNAGDFCGNYTDGTSGLNQPFTNIGGVVTSYPISGASLAAAYQLTNSNQFCGYYTDSNGINHGFYLDDNGDLQLPIDPAGSTGTILFGMNDRDWMVGRYSDSTGATHALIYLPAAGRFISYDYSGSTFTSFNGINRRGVICGRYSDSLGIEHGFIARASTTATDGPGIKVIPLGSSAPVRNVAPAAPGNRPAS